MDNLKIFSGSELNIMSKENIILAVSHETFKNVHKKPATATPAWKSIVVIAAHIVIGF